MCVCGMTWTDEVWQSYWGFEGIFNVENKVLNKGNFVKCIDDLETWMGTREA